MIMAFYRSLFGGYSPVNCGYLPATL